MNGNSKPSKDLRVRDVRLHSRGKTENGSLHLSKYHLIFSYLPEATPSGPNEPRASDSGSRAVSANYNSLPAANTSLLTGPPSDTVHSPARGQKSAAPTNSDATSNGESQESTNESNVHPPNPQAHAHARPKEIWVPYPMINRCVLRPSHFQSQAVKPSDHNSSDWRESGDDGFPPLYGTSSGARPSTDSVRSTPYSSPQRLGPTRAVDPLIGNIPDSGRTATLRIRRRDFQMMAFHFLPSSSSSEKSPDESAKEVFNALRSRCCPDRIEDMLAFHFKPPQEELSVEISPYDARREFARMGIGSKVAEGPGSSWRLTDINREYSFSKTYPSALCVPAAVSDNMLKYGGPFRSRARIPVLTYLHSNGGSITRSSQPMVGVQNKRNPQDERLVSAIFSSHTPPSISLDDSPAQHPSLTSPSTSTLDTASSDSGINSDVPGLRPGPRESALEEKSTDQSEVPRKKIYGSTRRNLIIDARPRINALANRATGGGIEDISNYAGTSGVPVEKVFLNIANIHVMRASLDRVTESFANADYLDMKPNQETLRKSAWLSHISNLLDGAEMVARVVGLGGSHALVHCSDGWDRTAQVAALAEIMLDPFYRTLPGFITLVQKDFLSFGHKFRDRHGIEGCEKWFEVENERVNPSRVNDKTAGDANSLNALSSKAISGAKNWFEKNRSNIFRQSNGSASSLSDTRAPSPPPNPIIHSPPVPATKDDTERRTSEKEISPVFHQFLDAVFQLLYHKPDSFEFNERFLRRLYYQAYCGQYGEFLFNTENERAQYQDKTHSVWPHFLSRKHEFVNPDFVAHTSDPLLFPWRSGGSLEQPVEVRWWSTLFGRKNEDMNTPRSLAPPDPEPEFAPGALSTQTSSLTSDDAPEIPPEKPEQSQPTAPGLGSSSSSSSNTKSESRSFQSFEKMREGLTSTWASLRLPSPGQPSHQPQSSSAEVFSTDHSRREAEIEGRDDSVDDVRSRMQLREEETTSTADEEERTPRPDDGDPLGVSGSGEVKEMQFRKSDFAAFSQSTYRST